MICPFASSRPESLGFQNVLCEWSTVGPDAPLPLITSWLVMTEELLYKRLFFTTFPTASEHDAGSPQETKNLPQLMHVLLYTRVLAAPALPPGLMTPSPDWSSTKTLP